MSLLSPNENADDNWNNTDTFLLRVFGLNSVYSRLNENHHYYDEEDQLGMLQPTNMESTSGLAESCLNPGKALIDSDGDTHSARNSLNLDRNSLNLDRSSLNLGKNLPPDTNSPILDKVTLNADESFLNPDKNLLNSEPDLDVYSDSLGPPSPLLQGLRPATKEGSRPMLNTSTLRPASTNFLGAPDRSVMFQLPDNRDHGKPLQTLPLFNNMSFRRQAAEQRPPRPQYLRRGFTKFQIPPKERALYLWANIVNMDEFLIDVYYYYRGKGFMSILASRIVDLLILTFTLLFTTFLRWGIDYHQFFSHWQSNSGNVITLKDLVIPGFLIHKVPGSVKFLLLGFSSYISLRVLQLYFDAKYKLSELRNFYRHLLEITDDAELMTISWSTIVERIMLLKDQNSLTASTHRSLMYTNDLNSKVRLNAHDIANRIMRKENYMIALINKDVLDISIPLPLFLSGVASSKSVLTRTLEWNIKICINNFIFNDNGQINQNVLKESSRNLMSQELNSRFKMAAIINLILCPFIVIYFVLLYFFRYFNEYKVNPSSLLGLRQYTPWAEWKLREFNELPHFFNRRLHLSIGPANTYISQFPSSVLVINLLTLVNFISGALIAVLVIMGLLFENEEHNFWSFELTEGRSTLFYISVFGTLFAVSSNPEKSSQTTSTADNSNSRVASFFYDPEASLRYVAQFTHYLPSSWNGMLHTVEVKNRFCELFKLKIVIILNEILSLILTPFVLWFKISNNSSAIIDFFREYTIHVDGLGHVCYFAMFNFEEKDKNMMIGTKGTHNTMPKRKAKAKKPKATRSDSESSSEGDLEGLDDYYQDDKMIKSYMYFLESYGNKGQNAPAHERERPSSSMNPAASKKLSQGTKQESNIGNSYDLNPSVIESIKVKKKGRKGVLGMINQFSRQEAGL